DVLKVNNLWFLGYRDSGMDGTDENRDPRSLVQTSAADVVGKLVAIIREFRPQIMITFDETGGYGHPDHIAIYKHTTSAFHAAADNVLYPELGPAHAVSKLYYASFSRRQVTMMSDWLEEQGYPSVFDGLDSNKLGRSDEQISAVLDVERWQETKGRSWSMHRTQTNPNSTLSRLPQDIQRKCRSTEY